jgi:hypothetical protein
MGMNKVTDTTGTASNVTGEDLARAAASDFSSLFLPGQAPVFSISVEGAHHACIRRTGEDIRIVIPPDMARENIEDADRMFFHLLIIGHELAHLVHRHLHAAEQEKADYRALEFWADFYGAKMMMALISHGEGCGALFRRFFPEKQVFEAPLESIGRAVGRLVETTYSDDSRYPPKLLRVGLTSNGVTSFLRHSMADQPPIWYFSVFKQIFGSAPVKELMLFNPEQAELGIDPLERALKWHREMQGSAAAITPGFKPAFADVLHTSFDQTEGERKASATMRLIELQAAGYLLDETVPEIGDPPIPRR